MKEVDRDEYAAQVELVSLFLDGKHDRLVTDLERRMRTAAADLRYELAAVYRDQLRSIDRVRSTQRIAVVKNVDQDVVGIHRAGDQVELALLMVRGGHLNRVHTFALRGITLPDDELLANFVREYYQSGATIPDEVVVPTPIEAAEGLAEWLTERRTRKVELRVPKRGARKRLVEMALENAEHSFREKSRAREDLDRRLGELARKLRLPVVPRRIESIDNSHLGGHDTVAAITALRDGEPDRDRYRTFRVRRANAGDDFGAMREVIERRFKRAGAKEAGWSPPDLFVVDGGKGQLRAAQTALQELSIEGLHLAALAKERQKGGEKTAVERVFLPGQKNAIILPARSASRHLLTLVRDEAHRVSNRMRIKVGKRRRMKSGLDDIPGVGPKTRATLLKKLGSLKAIIAADLDGLIAAGANRRQAEAIYRTFHAAQENAADAEREALENAFDA